MTDQPPRPGASVDELLALVEKCAANERKTHDAIQRIDKGHVGFPIAMRLLVDLKLMGEMVADLLGEAQPCGFEEPEVNRYVAVPMEWSGLQTAEDARHMARMLLRAADAAEKGTREPPQRH
jgi:hypothetical protein